MKNLHTTEFTKISAGLIDVSYSPDGHIYSVAIYRNFGSKHQVLIHNDLTFTIEGCTYLGSPIISGGHYSGYKIDVQISQNLPGSLGAAHYKLKKV